MKIKDFELELKQISSGLSIQSNKHVPGLAGVYFKGEYLFAIPDNDIFDEIRMGYTVIGFDGRSLVHRSRKEALGMAKAIVSRLNNEDYYNATMGEGQYSDKALNESTPDDNQPNILLPN